VIDRIITNLAGNEMNFVKKKKNWKVPFNEFIDWEKLVWKMVESAFKLFYGDCAVFFGLVLNLKI
jgi:hypothetical protein